MGRSVNKEYAKRNRSRINTKLKILLRRIVTENSQRCGLRSDMNLNRDSVWVWLRDNYGLIFYVSLLRMNCGTASFFLLIFALHHAQLSFYCHDFVL